MRPACWGARANLEPDFSFCQSSHFVCCAFFCLLMGGVPEQAWV
jgi:hypothetical protein